MASSRSAKSLKLTVLGLALANGLGALFFSPTPKQQQTAAAVTVEISDVTSSSTVDIRSQTVLRELFNRVNTDVAAIASDIKSGRGRVDTTQLHADIAQTDSALKLEMEKTSTQESQKARGLLVRELVDLQAKLHSLDTDAELLQGYARMHQDKLTNMHRLYNHNPSLTSFCASFTGYLNTLIRAPPSQHPDWPNTILTLNKDIIEGMIAMVDAQTAKETRPEAKAALAQLINRYPQAMDAVPSLRRLIEKKIR